MGILKSSAEATDDCCTVCVAGVGIVLIAAVGFPTIVALNLAASPVSVPVYLARTSRYTKFIRKSITELPEDQKKALLKELGVDCDDAVTWKVYSKHVQMLLKKAKMDYEKRRYSFDSAERNKKTPIEMKAENCPKFMIENVVTKLKGWTYEMIHDANCTFARYLVSLA